MIFVCLLCGFVGLMVGYVLGGLDCACRHLDQLDHEKNHNELWRGK